MASAPAGWIDCVDPADAPPEPLLAVTDLCVTYAGGDGHAVSGTSLAIGRGRVVGIAGESGSGKSTLARAVMGLLPSSTTVSGSLRFEGLELIGLREPERRRTRGRGMAMVFQETTTSLNPVLRIGRQLQLAIRANRGGSRAEVSDTVRTALRAVGLSDVARIGRSYPNELSGGECQRVVIAMAIACGSRLIIADEPTTALDVSIQREILRLLRDIVVSRSVSILFISHDLGVLAEICDEILVMYQGEIVEHAPASTLLAHPRHPYTKALIACLPSLATAGRQLPTLPPHVVGPQSGCRFAPRCPFATQRCEEHPSQTEVGSGHWVRCWHHDRVDRAPAEALVADG